MSIELAAPLVAEFEGFSATPYLCPAGVWTIGHGSTFHRDGRRVTQRDPAISAEQALAMLQHDLRTAAAAVDRHVVAPLSPTQRAALISLVHNIGQGAFARSTLLRHLNAGLHHLAAEQFLRWNRIGDRVMRGLTRRRERERALFLTEPPA